MIEYEYKCNTCGHEFSTHQSIKDKPLTLCFCCQQQTLERLMSGGLYGKVKREPTTLGQQAEANTKKMGKCRLEERRAVQPPPLKNKTEHQRKLEKVISGGADKVNRYIRTGK